MISFTGRHWLLNSGPAPGDGLEDRLLAAMGLVPSVSFFTPSFEADCHDPLKLSGMEAAVERLDRALDKGETIRVFGDYDVDGMTGAAVLAETFAILGGKVGTMIPNRLSEGYGLSRAAIDAAADSGASVLVTADCGISSREEVSHAKSRGIDVIICDHHELPPVLPEAYATLHPRQEGDTYPFKHLTGVGVAAKFAHALLRKRLPDKAGEIWRGLLDLVALGTLADQGELSGENRYLVREGLRQLSTRSRAGLAALLRLAKVEEWALSEEHVAFKIAPRLNAAGRMHHPGSALKLLTTRDPAEALALARELEDYNNRRRTRTTEIFAEIQAVLEREPPRCAVVLADPSWSVGLLGLLASKVVEQYRMPAVLFEDRSEELIGSARSVPGFDVHAALASCRDLFSKFGGHAQAAGLTLPKANFAAFRECFTTACAAIERSVERPPLELATRLGLEELTLDTAKILRRFGPFGAGHPVPLFLLEGLEVAEARPIGDGTHLRLDMRFAGSIRPVTLTAFGWGEHKDALQPGTIIDAAVQLSSSVWQGRERLELRVTDLRGHKTA